MEPNAVEWKEKDIFSTLNSAKETSVFRLLTIRALKFESLKQGAT